MKIKYGLMLFAIALLSYTFWWLPAEPNTADSTEHATANSKSTPTSLASNIIPKTIAAPSVQVLSPTTEDIRTLSPIDRIRAIQEKTELHQSILNDHSDFTRYPANNTRISESERDPVERRYQVDERITHSEEHHVALTVWSDQKYYLYGDKAKIYATLQNEDGIRLKTDFVGQLIFNESNNLGILEFEDTNQDHIYELLINLDKKNESSFSPGIYKILIANKDNELIDSVAFVLSEPDAQLTGEFRDRITNEGNLIIEAEIEVQKANRYSVEASLYSANNDPIGHTQFADNFSPGKHWLPLSFFGLLMHDAAEPGPYLLKSLSLAKVAMPIERTPMIEPGYYTEAYSLDDFSSTSFSP